jgi:WD40 repeat protein/serine/threonine protein kinase
MSKLDGQTIRGYELRGTIGTGGFGTVYTAYQSAIQREVAIKVINERYINQIDFIRRFEAEARIIARLEHPHIVPLYDYWRDPQGAYLVMRWFRGGSLRAYLEKQRLSLAQISDILHQMTSALMIAHERDIIHRDIKPENILLDTQGNAYLTDFGIAIDLLHDREITMENISFGSPQYIAPEQLTEKRVTPQSDVYSLGIMLYELLSGQAPFEHQQTTRVIEMQLHNPVPSLLTVRPELPHELDDIIWKATAKKPEARFDTARDFAERYDEIVKNIPDDIANKLPTQDNKGTSDVYATSQLGLSGQSPPVGTQKLGTPSPAQRHQTRQFEGLAIPANIHTNLSNPYKGLRPFEEADAHNFFGREVLIAQLLDHIEVTDERFLALIGPSGSGKSSVVRAGILPILRQSKMSNTAGWFITEMVPSTNPLRELAQAILRVSINAPADFVDVLRERIENLHTYLPQVLPQDDAQVVLFIDQFEEVFTLCDSEEERAHFLDMLSYAIEAEDSHLRLIVTLRADFYDRPLHYAQFGELLQKNTQVILPLDMRQLETAIVRPAELTGVVIDSDLRHAIINDVQNQPGALPLMQYAMTQLFEQRQDNRLSLSAYQAIGGITGALAQRASELYADLAPDAQHFVRQMLLRLIAIGDGEKATRRRVRWDALLSGIENAQQYSTVIETFVNSRLLTLDRDPITRTPTVEIAHEALITGWEQFRLWIQSNQADLNRREQLRTATQAWLSAQEESSYLARGGRLAEFEGLLNNNLLMLDADEVRYLDASIALRQRSTRRTQMVIALLTVFSVVTFIMAVAALLAQQTAERATAEALLERDRANASARVAQAGELAASALANLDDNDLAMLLSVEAVTVADTYEARNSLLTSLQANPYVEAFLHGHGAQVRAVAYNSDGSQAVTAGRDGTIQRWDSLRHQAMGAPLEGHRGAINRIAISPDDTTLASVGADGTLRFWDMESGDALASFSEHDGAIWSVAFSPDGTQVISGGADGQVVVYDANTFEVFEHLPSAHSGIIYAVAYHPDGTQFATGGDDLLVKLWDNERLESIMPPLEGHNNWIRTLAYHPNGRILASSGADTLIQLWDTSNGESLGAIDTGHLNWVQAVAFSPDGGFIASASMDETIQVWNLQLGQAITPQPLHAHTGSIWDMRFHPQQFSLLSGAEDGDAIIWQISLPHRPGQVLLNADTANALIALDNRSTWMALANNNPNRPDGTIIQVLSIEDNALVQGFTQHDTIVTAMAFHPQEALMASASAGQVFVWDIATGERLATLQTEGLDVLMSKIAFSPDGDMLIMANEQGLVRLWAWSESPEATQSFTAQATGITALAISDDGRYVALGSRDASIEVWAIEDVRLVQRLSDSHRDAVEALTFVDDNTLLSGGRDSQIIVWDLVTGEASQQPIVTSDWVLSLAVHPGEGWIASSSRDTTIHLWDLESIRPIGNAMIGHRDWVTQLHIEDDTLISASRDGLLLAWDTSLENLDMQIIANLDETCTALHHSPQICATLNTKSG